jgi:hypothetical protein
MIYVFCRGTIKPKRNTENMTSEQARLLSHMIVQEKDKLSDAQKKMMQLLNQLCTRINETEFKDGEIPVNYEQIVQLSAALRQQSRATEEMNIILHQVLERMNVQELSKMKIKKQDTEQLNEAVRFNFAKNSCR